ncbi:MAG: precorrin-8X methylmutase [Nitrospinae bacterium]|nr:precorrin-8X methylmutase [Nitrospinota bacterium]
MDNQFAGKKTAALLLGHGSRVKEANGNMLRVARSLEEKGVFLTVRTAFLELCPPDIPEGIRACAEKGAEQIIVAPYFLHMGMHVRRDLPEIIKQEALKYPDMRITYARNIGFHPLLVDILLERLAEAASFKDIREAEIPSEAVIVNDAEAKAAPALARAVGKFRPDEIEAESFRIILEEMGENHFSPNELPIVQRAVHASGDLEFAKLIYFHPGFLEAAKEAISGSKALLTDVNMVMAGVNRKLTAKYGMDLHCFISDEGLKAESERTGLTRSCLGIRKGASLPNVGGVLIGNAPTALREVVRLHKKEGFRPGFVIGTPVGFVDAEESKDALIQSGIPCVAVRGRKGGSPIAAAIMNAVLLLFDKL